MTTDDFRGWLARKFEGYTWARVNPKIERIVNAVHPGDRPELREELRAALRDLVKELL